MKEVCVMLNISVARVVLAKVPLLYFIKCQKLHNECLSGFFFLKRETHKCKNATQLVEIFLILPDCISEEIWQDRRKFST